MNTDQCPLCRGPVKMFSRYGTGWAVDCPKCTLFAVHDSVIGALESASAEERGELSLAIRGASARGEDPHLDSSTLHHYRRMVTPATVNTRRVQVLQHLARVSPEAGSSVTFSPREHYLDFDCKTPEALHWILQSLEATGEILREIGGNDDRFLVTHKGWSASEVARGAFLPGTCFVAMSFEKPRMSPVRESIRASLQDDCQLKSIIIDEVEHVNRIDDEIVARLRTAQFVVADFTGQRGGVYFEAGFAQGLGRPVIWTCERADLLNLHFDTRNFNFIDWVNPDDLRARLTRRIRSLGLAAKLT